MRAGLQPGPELRRLLGHAVLDIGFFHAIARPSEGEPLDHAGLLPFEDVFAEEKIGGAALVTEEKPIAAAIFFQRAMLQEGAEGCDAGAGADHDDGGIGALGQAEMAGLDEDRQGGRGTMGKMAGGDAIPQPAAPLGADDADAEIDMARHGAGAGGDGVEPRLEAWQGGDQLCQGWAGGGEGFEQIQQIGIGGFGGLLTIGEGAQGGGLGWVFGVRG